jgi:hypothetical protein
MAPPRNARFSGSGRSSNWMSVAVGTVPRYLATYLLAAWPVNPDSSNDSLARSIRASQTYRISGTTVGPMRRAAPRRCPPAHRRAGQRATQPSPSRAGVQSVDSLRRAFR